MQAHSYSLLAFQDIITNNGKLYNIFHLVYFFFHSFTRPTTKLISDNTGAYLQLSELHYDMGELEDALRLVTQFLFCFIT